MFQRALAHLGLFWPTAEMKQKVYIFKKLMISALINYIDYNDSTWGKKVIDTFPQLRK